ncbi:DNA repair protein RecO [Chlorobium sp. N1]|uniref:DNA repair protein RecO n=1 Tax=Chlorobium sp. N1 TaxID=2491138 RepID=UPI001038D19A|nr:DNA repair protein RecO [Chlorobium sp. N1]TCD48108.1 DNA repair protein RecO [Chlorobium sp. N1]
MIVKTRAVVLREVKYRDQSKIVTLYTREFGRLSAILKGARNPKSRLAGIFTAGNVLDTILYQRPEREVQLVSDASLVSCPMSAGADIERFGVLYALIDLVRRSTGHDGGNPRLFALVESTLLELNREGAAYRRLHAWFLLRFISLEGFAPELSRCVLSGRGLSEAAGDNELLFVMNPGGLALRGSAHPDGRNITAVPVGAARLLCRLERTATAAEAAAGGKETETEHAGLCGTILHAYCRHHLEDAGPDRSLAVISRLLSE